MKDDMAKDHSHSHDHDHDHDHDHGHHHHHHHHNAAGNIGIAFFLNLIFAAIEIVGGIWTGSMAIVADAVHDLGDSVSLGVAFVLQKYSSRGRTNDYTYGYGRFSLLSALIAGVVILVGGSLILWETVPRLWRPQEAPHGLGMMALAFLGIGVNGFAAWRLSRGQTQNEKILSWHLIEDLLGWVAVLIGAIVILMTGWTWVDPILAVGLSLFVMWNVSRNLWQTIQLFLQRTPETFDSERFRRRLEGVRGICGIHDLHAWSIDGAHNILSLHILLDPGFQDISSIEAVKQEVRRVARELGRYHVTVEVEFSSGSCVDDCESNTSSSSQARG